MDTAPEENGKKVLTMAEYIKREYAIDAVLDVYYDTPDIDLSGEKFEAAIRKIQAADVAPVRHGRWITKQEKDTFAGYLYSYECSECGRVEQCKEPYCNCGAKMDLEEKQHELRRDL